ncbi:pterin-4-alpha-carbinolamine dehydratase 2, mitochondrial [Ricinus communis]|uniref:pterin-4-alpha-carbinolamine dehydratase 2, mitochondrial n=1 Tax=Ricinus communis TaxID=3988 RepID=UPI0007724CB3|nr:pterin-4-alpha-carbinolamine dehydratase 2, mitochondrial [Ricinus communis]|eukprot:XP_015575004.1 pterin-4-alpha-carbinolamine dehydratase 2, mitochondrial [Ricinus communis]
MTRLLLPLRLSLYRPKAPLASRFQTLLTPNGHSSTRPILGDRLGLSSNRNTFYGFRNFCTGGDLAAKKCVPCNMEDLRPMTEKSATGLMSKVEGWDLVKEDGVLKLNLSLKVRSFTKGLELFQIVGNLAEKEGHHPDLHLVGWNNVKIEIWTHAVGGLTENDFILAAKINGLNLHQLLRKKVGT